MTDNDFAGQFAAMREAMYRVSYAQLSQSAERDDAVQEALLKAWSNRHRLTSERHMQTWVIRILINECHNIHRKRAREIPLAEPPERIAPPDTDADLHDALFRLDEGLRTPVTLHYIEGFQVSEIAKILRVPQGTVLWRLSKARKLLREMLSEDGKPEAGRLSQKEV